MSEIIRTVLALGAVVVAVLVLARLAGSKRLKMLATPSLLSIEARVSLAPKSYLAVVLVDGQRYLLAVSQGRIEKLAELGKTDTDGVEFIDLSTASDPEAELEKAWGRGSLVDELARMLKGSMRRS